MVFKQHDLAVRIQALALVEEGIAVKRVTELTGLARATVYDLKKKARQRGYDPTISRILKMEYVEDAPRSGRPKLATEANRNKVVEHVRTKGSQKHQNLVD